LIILNLLWHLLLKGFDPYFTEFQRCMCLVWPKHQFKSADTFRKYSYCLSLRIILAF